MMGLAIPQQQHNLSHFSTVFQLARELRTSELRTWTLRGCSRWVYLVVISQQQHDLSHFGTVFQLHPPSRPRQPQCFFAVVSKDVGSRTRARFFSCEVLFCGPIFVLSGCGTAPLVLPTACSFFQVFCGISFLWSYFCALGCRAGPAPLEPVLRI